MTDSLRESYEATPYESRAITASHIDRMAVVARLRGLSTAAPEHCRVLELGCASGGNLIPMAMNYPGSHFVGIDLAPRHIASAECLRDELALHNTTFLAGSILDIDDSFGTFDYIIAHGVYSWVPPDVQDALLRISSRNLAPTGVAYVSYNTYPGWHAPSMLREMLMMQDNPALQPPQRVARARAFADRLVAASSGAPKTYLATLREEGEALRGESDWHQLHEQLEPFNLPVYFSEFVRRAAGYGLQYLAESNLAESGNAMIGMMAQGDPTSDWIRCEQYYDFIRGRKFRRTLLCHREAEIGHTPDVSFVPTFHVVSRVTEVAPSAADLARSASVKSFRSAENATVTTDDPLITAMMHEICETKSASLSFADVAAAVRGRVREASSTPVDASNARIAQQLLSLASSGFLALRTAPLTHATALSEHPVASPLARLQSVSPGLVTSLTHQSVDVAALERFILPLLDGTHDRRDVATQVEQAIADGRISTGDEKPDNAQITEAVDAVLTRFLQAALLVS